MARVLALTADLLFGSRIQGDLGAAEFGLGLEVGQPPASSRREPRADAGWLQPGQAQRRPAGGGEGAQLQQGVGAGVADENVRRRRIGQEVHAEVVGRLADRSRDPPLDARLCAKIAAPVDIDRLDTVVSLVERGTDEIVHPGIDEEPASVDAAAT